MVQGSRDLGEGLSGFTGSELRGARLDLCRIARLSHHIGDLTCAECFRVQTDNLDSKSSRTVKRKSLSASER